MADTISTIDFRLALPIKGCTMLPGLLAGVLALAMLVLPVTIQAQAYPTRTVRLILPFPPSGGTDILGRGIAQTLSMKELVELARKSPGKLNFGSGGVGTSVHLTTELLKSLTGINIVHVPYGMFVPAGTPRELVNRLNQELRRTLANPELVKRLDSAGIETGASTPEELGRFVKSESARFGKVIKNAGIKPI